MRLLEKKNPAQNGIWPGQVLGGLVRESVIHETLARAFPPNSLLESTAAQATGRSSLASGAPDQPNSVYRTVYWTLRLRGA